MIRRVAAALAVVVLALTGCSTLPSSGPVHTRADAGADQNEGAPYFAPPGPVAGDSREGVARGFLLAMQANPPSTTVARDFLSARARSAWKPVRGTIVYDASSVALEGDDLVHARLSDAHRLDPSGGWDTGAAAETADIPFRMVRENGEWRIDNPPDGLAVPASYFSSIFVPFSLYFFDRTGTVLTPTRIYLPRGSQTASNLVRGLLAGPPPGLREVVESAAPPRTSLDFGVVVSDAGVAEVPLSGEILDLLPGELNRLVVQLAWTLRQVPGITRFRITVDGATVPLPDGRAEISVRVGSEFDPLSAPEEDPVAIVDGRAVRIGAAEPSDLGGPFGVPGFALRSIALDVRRHHVAAVAASGRRLYLADDRGSRAASKVQLGLENAANLLRPVYDRFGSLWTVDATANGAVVHVLRNGRDRVVRLEGISGQRVVAFTITRDGTRFAAALTGGESPRVAVAPLVRAESGGFLHSLPATVIEFGGSEASPVRDIAQYGGTTVVLLTQPAGGPGQLVVVELDGSPGESAPAAPELVPGTVVALAAGPSAAPPLVVTAERRLLRLGESGQWERTTLTDVRAVAYPE